MAFRGKSSISSVRRLHEGAGFPYLSNRVQSATVGPGVPYVLLTDGNLYEDTDGTDPAGRVNCVMVSDIFRGGCSVVSESR
jgi:hypothetical protein